MIYQNFDLEIICPQGGNRLCARVLESPQGDCPFIDVKWPFDADTENRLLTDIYGGLRQRHGRSLQANSIQDFGGKLFEAVFSGDIEHLFRSSLDTSFREGKGLRVRLRLPEDSELHMRPWEFLFDTESREFLAVREHTPLVRYLPVAQPIPPITVEGPLRVLVALSSPTDHPRLDIAREWEILCHALEPSISAGQLVLRRVPGHCTFDNLRDSLRHFHAHIFHFVGHGIPGALVLEQESGKGLEMEATHLRSAFPSGALPRLIVLNACSGAITQDVPFSGLAQGFLRQGVPAVVAMQASITDDAAMIFTRYFYRDLVEIGAVDASLTEARLRMQGNGHPIEWGTPVLYMRALSGQLFRPAENPVSYPDEPTMPKEIPVKAAAPPPRAEPHLDEPRKKTRESPPRQDAPPPAPPPPPPPPAPAAGQGEKKKSRVVRVKDNVSQLKPGPAPEQRPSPKVTVKEWTPPSTPAPEPAGPDITAKIPPQQALAATVQAPPASLPPKPEPRPADSVFLSKPEPKAELKPAPKIEQKVEPPIGPTVQAEEFTVPLPPEPKPAGRPVPPRPPARLEPGMDRDKTLANGQPKPFVPVFTFDPDPDLTLQGIPGAGGTPASGAPAQAKGPAEGRKRGRVVAAAGLLAAVAGIAIGVKLLSSTGSTPEAASPRSTITPIASAPSIPSSPTAPPASAPTAPVTPSTALPEIVTAPLASGTADKGRPDPRAQSQEPLSTPKSVAATTRKGQSTRQSATAARRDLCSNAVVSERPASCLLKK